MTDRSSEETPMLPYMLTVRLEEETRTEPGMYLKEIAILTKFIQDCIARLDWYYNGDKRWPISVVIDDAVVQIKLLSRKAGELDHAKMAEFGFTNTKYIENQFRKVAKDYNDLPLDTLYTVIDRLISSRKELASLLAMLFPVQSLSTRAAEEAKPEWIERARFIREGPPKMTLSCSFAFEDKDCQMQAEDVRQLLATYEENLRIAWESLPEKMMNCRALRESYYGTLGECEGYLNYIKNIHDVWYPKCKCIDTFRCTNSKDHFTNCKDLYKLRDEKGRGLNRLLNEFCEILSSHRMEGIENTYIVYAKAYRYLHGFVDCFLLFLEQSEQIYNKLVFEAKGLPKSLTDSAGIFHAPIMTVEKETSCRNEQIRKDEKQLEKGRLELHARELKRLAKERIDEHERERARLSEENRRMDQEERRNQEMSRKRFHEEECQRLEGLRCEMMIKELGEMLNESNKRARLE